MHALAVPNFIETLFQTDALPIYQKKIQVFIVDEMEDQQCSGTLIRDDVVLTSASCLFSKLANNAKKVIFQHAQSPTINIAIIY